LYSYLTGLKLKDIVDREGRMLNFSYYDDGKIKDIWKSLYNSSASYPFRLYHIEYGDNITYATDAREYRSLIKLNELGNPTAITDPTGNVTRRTWDDGMNMVSLTDANGHTTAYDYDEYGNLIKKTNPLGNVTGYEWRNIDSNPEYISLLLSTTDALGHTTSYGYDEKGTGTERPMPQGIAHITSMTRLAI
ncbi:hypothetical protein C5S32_02920, partial [ANME-1 cluster archaeon GoMg1]|nr:hypothetical protein [ANME-1 cluster archaeon GoMg1]